MAILLPILISLAAVAACFLVLNAKINRRIKIDTIVDEIRQELAGLIVEINQTTDRNIELIENRVDQLKNILKDADRRIGVLKKEVTRREKTADLYTHLGSHGKPQGSNQAAAALPQDPTSAPPPSAGEPGNREAKKTRVTTLYLQGFSSEQIATKVGITVGEVELIVALYERNDRGQ